MKFKNADEVIQLIEQKKRNGIALRQLKQFMETQGNPQLQLPCIHVGGTNGKGSTTNILATVLIDAGYRVGTFTSPYLETHHDRIRINEVFIEDNKIVEYANEYYDEWIGYDLSMFEIDMFVATKYFLENNVDIAIFEVGLGGEQDATNIVNPLVSVITNIGLDHMDYLGNTYAEIAQAKAGIIKKGKALITSERKSDCLAIFDRICRQQESELIICDMPKHILVDDKLHFDYQSYNGITQPTLASYQAQNTCLAIETLLYLRTHNEVSFSDETMIGAIAHAVWKGRFEVIHKKPTVIIDGAHNVEGIQALAESCKPFSKVKILFTALKDKPYHEMLEKLLKITKDVTICEFAFYRAQKANVIGCGYPVRIIENAQEAIDELMSETEDNEILLICGSLYFISEARSYLLNK